MTGTGTAECSTPIEHRRRRGGDTAAPPRSRRPRVDASGWIVKIVLLGLVDALAITGLLIALDAGGVGLRRRARRDARRPQRRLPAAALRTDEVPAARAVLPRRVRRLPGAVHGVHVDDELRHRLRADARTRRSTRSRASRSARCRTRSATTSPRSAATDGHSPATACSTRRPSRSCSAPTEGVEPLDEPAELQVLTTTGRTFIVSVGDLEGVRPGDVDTLPAIRPTPSRTSCPARRRARRSGSPAARRSRAARRACTTPETATITDTSTDPPTVYTETTRAVRVRGRRHARRRGSRRRSASTTTARCFTGTRYSGVVRCVLLELDDRLLAHVGVRLRSPSGSAWR